MGDLDGVVGGTVGALLGSLVGDLEGLGVGIEVTPDGGSVGVDVGFPVLGEEVGDPAVGG